MLTGVIGAGALLRYHTTTRYFMDLDVRVERDGAKAVGVLGIGMGVLVGKNKTPPGKRLRGQRKDKTASIDEARVDAQPAP